MKLKELIKHRDFRWLNRFVGDFLLILCVFGLQYLTHFNSKTVFLITGMIVVWITWQFSDYINSKRRLNG